MGSVYGVPWHIGSTKSKVEKFIVFHRILKGAYFTEKLPSIVGNLQKLSQTVCDFWLRSGVYFGL